MIRFLRTAIGLSFACTSALVIAEDMRLLPLEDIVWPVSYNVQPGVVVDTAIALKAQGKRLELNYSNPLVSQASVYDSPLDVCAAALHAIIEVNESWWGELCAPWSERDGAGVPNAGYTPDSAENMYSWYTYFTVEPQFGQITDANIRTYLRVGNLHAFDVAWIRTTNGVVQAPTHAILAVEEGPNAKFRLAPEWMRFDEPVSAYLNRTSPESQLLADYRNAVPSQAHEVIIDGLYGGSPGIFPLTILFRGSIPQACSKYQQISTFVAAYAAQTASVPEDGNEFANSEARTGLANLLTAEGLEILDEADSFARSYNPFQSDMAFVIDGGALLLVYVKGSETGELVEGFRELIEDDGSLKLANYLTSTPLQAFFSSELIWPKFSAKILEILAQSN